MGGRGKDSGHNVHQTTFDDVFRQKSISKIIEEHNIKRSSMNGFGTRDNGSSQLFKKCACCGEYTIPIGSLFAECPICNWVDDDYQNNHPESLDGRNKITLTQAKSIYFARIMNSVHESNDKT